MSHDQKPARGRQSLEVPFAIVMGLVFIVAAAFLYINAKSDRGARMAREIETMDQMLGDAFKPESPHVAPANAVEQELLILPADEQPAHKQPGGSDCPGLDCHQK